MDPITTAADRYAAASRLLLAIEDEIDRRHDIGDDDPLWGRKDDASTLRAAAQEGLVPLMRAAGVRCVPAAGGFLVVDAVPEGWRDIHADGPGADFPPLVIPASPDAPRVL